MSIAEKGKKVTVHYTGKLKDGKVFESSAGKEPLHFDLGSGKVIPGFENAILGMDEGEKKTVEIAMDNAYGPRREDMIAEFQKTQFPDNLELKTGMVFQLNTGDGQTLPVFITEIKDQTVVVDGNHPLAGHDLVFDIELVSVDDASGN